MPLTETDRRLINELLTGKEGVWEEFVNRYSSLIIQVIRHTAHAHSLKISKHDEDDLCADTFAALLDRNMSAIRDFRGKASFATYLGVVARRIVLRHITRKRYREALGHVTVHKAAMEARGDRGEVSAVDAREELDSLMSRLPAHLRSVLKLFYLEDQSYRDIGRRLGLPMNSIGPMLSRARALLKSSKS